MKAVGYQKSLSIDFAESLQDIDLAEPKAEGHDLLVEVKAISVNPVDTKVGKAAAPPAGEWKVLGWDAAGVVRATGSGVTLFKPGDRVWYAGDLTRQGTNAELHLVDERIVGGMPAKSRLCPCRSPAAYDHHGLGDAVRQIGAVPGKRPTSENLLIIGAAGGVGSIMTQLVRRLTGVTVIGTASRPETQAWVRKHGCPACDRPHPSTSRRAAAHRHQRGQSHCQPDPDRSTFSADRRCNRPAGQIRAH